MKKKSYHKEYYEKNRDKIIARAKENYQNNKEVKKAYNKQWQKNNPDKVKASRKKRSKALTKKSKDWYYNNHEHALKTRQEYRAKDENKQKMAEYHKQYRKENLGYTNSIKKRYKLAKKKRTPAWLTKEQIKEIDSFYILAYTKTQETGIQHHVDHIIPLQGKNVSGLHVPWNLQVLTAKENTKKSNKCVKNKLE
jgi:hypothetical protein